MKQITFGSLFAGIGGIDLGFERAGMVCKWQVEINPYAQRVLAKHWPEVRRHDDVRTWPQPDTERVDVIAGGFPCQDISYAGKGAGLAGERSGLFYEVARIVREMEPRVVVLENVAALLTRGLGDVLGTLASLGYDAEWHCIPAAAVGAPHIRDRMFIVGTAANMGNASGHNARQFNVRKVEQQRPYSAGVRGGLQLEPSLSSKDVSDADSQRLTSAQGQRAAAASSRRNKPIANDWWNAQPAVGRVANGVPARVDRLRGLGNAVVPQVAEYVGRMITEVMV